MKKLKTKKKSISSLHVNLNTLMKQIRSHKTLLLIHDYISQMNLKERVTAFMNSDHLIKNQNFIHK